MNMHDWSTALLLASISFAVPAAPAAQEVGRAGLGPAVADDVGGAAPGARRDRVCVLHPPNLRRHSDQSTTEVRSVAHLGHTARGVSDPSRLGRGALRRVGRGPRLPTRLMTGRLARHGRRNTTLGCGRGR